MILLLFNSVLAPLFAPLVDVVKAIFYFFLFMLLFGGFNGEKMEENHNNPGTQLVCSKSENAMESVMNYHGSPTYSDETFTTVIKKKIEQGWHMGVFCADYEDNLVYFSLWRLESSNQERNPDWYFPSFGGRANVLGYYSGAVEHWSNANKEFGVVFSPIIGVSDDVIDPGGPFGNYAEKNVKTLSRICFGTEGEYFRYGSTTTQRNTHCLLQAVTPDIDWVYFDPKSGAIGDYNTVIEEVLDKNEVIQ